MPNWLPAPPSPRTKKRWLFVVLALWTAIALAHFNGAFDAVGEQVSSIRETATSHLSARSTDAGPSTAP